MKNRPTLITKRIFQDGETGAKGRGGWWSRDSSKYLKGLLDCESVSKVTWDGQIEIHPTQPLVL